MDLGLFTLGSNPLASGLPDVSAASTPTFGSPAWFGFSAPSLTNPTPSTPSSGGVFGFFSELTSADLWERVGLVILGMIFIAISLYLFGNKTVMTVTESVRR